MNKRYLGDAVYVEIKNGMILLTTEYGDGTPTNEIYIEPEVWRALKAYMAELEVNNMEQNK